MGWEGSQEMLKWVGMLAYGLKQEQGPGSVSSTGENLLWLKGLKALKVKN